MNVWFMKNETIIEINFIRVGCESPNNLSSHHISYGLSLILQTVLVVVSQHQTIVVLVSTHAYLALFLELFLFVCFQYLMLLIQHLLRYQRIIVVYLVRLQLILHVARISWWKKLHAKISNDFEKTMVLFFHFLVVTPTLLSLSRANKISHGFEYFIHSPQLFHDEMLTINF